MHWTNRNRLCSVRWYASISLDSDMFTEILKTNHVWLLVITNWLNLRRLHVTVIKYNRHMTSQRLSNGKSTWFVIPSWKLLDTYSRDIIAIFKPMNFWHIDYYYFYSFTSQCQKQMVFPVFHEDWNSGVTTLKFTVETRNLP